MNEELNPESDHLDNEEVEFEKALRPKEFSDFKGQDGGLFDIGSISFGDSCSRNNELFWNECYCRPKWFC